MAASAPPRNVRRPIWAASAGKGYGVRLVRTDDGSAVRYPAWSGRSPTNTILGTEDGVRSQALPASPEI